MKKSIKIIASFICILIISLYIKDNVRADEDKNITKKQYEEYVNKIMIPKYGKVENIDKLNKNSEDFDRENPENWRAQKGIIATDIEDLNNDGKQECIVFYICDQISDDETDEDEVDEEEEEDVVEEEETCLRMAILSQQKGKIKESDNIVFRRWFNSSGWFNIQFYIKTQKDQKYIVLQKFGAIDGIGSSFYILSVTKDNIFFLEKAIRDSGGCDVVRLCRLDTTAHNLESSIDYDNEENILYESAGTSRDYEYKQKLEKELEEYGLEIKNSICRWGGLTEEMYVLKKDSTLKLIETMIGGLEIKTSEEK